MSFSSFNFTNKKAASHSDDRTFLRTTSTVHDFPRHDFPVLELHRAIWLELIYPQQRNKNQIGLGFIVCTQPTCYTNKMIWHRHMIPWTHESLYLSSSGFRNLVTWYALVVGEEHFHLWFKVFPIGKQWRKKKKLRLLFFFDTIPEFLLCIKIYLLSFHIQWQKELNILLLRNTRTNKQKAHADKRNIFTTLTTHM